MSVRISKTSASTIGSMSVSESNISVSSSVNTVVSELLAVSDMFPVTDAEAIEFIILSTSSTFALSVTVGVLISSVGLLKSLLT